MYICAGGQTDGQINAQTNAWMNKQADGQTEKPIGQQVRKWISRSTSTTVAVGNESAFEFAACFTFLGDRREL